MNESLITVRYVKALYELAEENKQLTEIVDDVQGFLEILNESKEFVDFIGSPVLKISEKKNTLDALFKNKITALSLRFLHLLIEKSREDLLKAICIHFISYYKKQQGIREAQITTARPLSKKHREEIYAFITKKFKVNLELTEKVDPDIIGGFVLQIDDQQINASIRSQLNKIRRELIHT